MVKSFLAVATVVFTLAVAGSTWGAPFYHKIDWNDTGSNPGYKEVTDSFQYTHTPAFDPLADEILSATLGIRHKDNQNWEFLGFGEVWFVYQDNPGTDIKIGTLGASTQGWVVDTFTLSQQVRDQIESNTPWSLKVKLTEGTWGEDKLKLDWSELAGEYSLQEAPVPEASTLVLLGSGLPGLALWANARRKRA